MNFLVAGLVNDDNFLSDYFFWKFDLSRAQAKAAERRIEIKTKIENIESQSNSTEISTSMYGNSQESIDVCDSNVVHGKRARTKRTQ